LNLFECSEGMISGLIQRYKCNESRNFPIKYQMSGQAVTIYCGGAYSPSSAIRSLLRGILGDQAAEYVVSHPYIVVTAITFFFLAICKFILSRGEAT